MLRHSRAVHGPQVRDELRGAAGDVHHGVEDSRVVGQRPVQDANLHAAAAAAHAGALAGPRGDQGLAAVRQVRVVLHVTGRQKRPQRLGGVALAVEDVGEAVEGGLVQQGVAAGAHVAGGAPGRFGEVAARVARVGGSGGGGGEEGGEGQEEKA